MQVFAEALTPLWGSSDVSGRCGDLLIVVVTVGNNIVEVMCQPHVATMLDCLALSGVRPRAKWKGGVSPERLKRQRKDCTWLRGWTGWQILPSAPSPARGLAARDVELKVGLRFWNQTGHVWGLAVVLCSVRRAAVKSSN